LDLIVDQLDSDVALTHLDSPAHHRRTRTRRAAAAMAKRAGQAQRETMSKVDTAWLRMEKSTNLMMISGVMLLATPLALADLKHLLLQRFLAYARFRQKAVTVNGSSCWEDDEAFDIDWHVRRTALPGAAGKSELQEMVSQLASTPLDQSRPLWQFHLIDKFGGGSALIVRIHHCYADGIALVQVLLSLTDVTPTPAPDSALPAAWLKDDGERITEQFVDPTRRRLDQAVKWTTKLLNKSVDISLQPSLAGMMMLEGSSILAELAHALALADDPPTPLKQPLGEAKRCAWAEPLPLVEVKTVCAALGCTVNDALMACVAGALRAHLIACGADVDGKTIRATVPVNLRPLEHAKKLGNHFGLVFLDLPIGEANPLARLERVAASMREIKASKQALVTYGALAALGMVPAKVQRAALDYLSRKATTVATNVPGPQMPLYLAGARLEQTLFWVPQSGSIGLGVSILSYNGGVHFGLMADRACLPDPDAVVARFRREFDNLVYILLMDDWQHIISADEAAQTLARYG